MQIQPVRFLTFVFVTCTAVLGFSGWAGADPPARVARLGYMTGAVSFSPSGEEDWVQASINRPLTTGDRLWADEGARTEIQVGGAMIRMSADTGLSILNIDDEIVQLQLTEGTLNVRVRRLEPNQVFEVDTPNLAFTIRQPGAFRIEVDPDGNATTIIVRKGQGEVYGEDASYVIDTKQAYRFTGTGLREYQYIDVPRRDKFDLWASDRDRRYDNSASARYVSQDVVGYQDLDANGYWRVDASYGNVWIPNHVAVGWAPYRDGHWAWIDPWGWTWVDDVPWGFTVSHYGRWANLSGTWGWVPGPMSTRAYYAPALVAFVGGSNFQLTISSGNVGAVAWFPLGPRDVYRPSYQVSRGYYENINSSNTVINTTVINNTYNNTNVTNIVYVNSQVPGAVVAVPTTAFVQSQPVSKAAQRVSRDTIVSAQVAFVPSVAPTEKSVRGAAAQGGQPPSRVFGRPVVARTAPPAASVGFAAQRQRLAAQPGKPLDDAARKELKPVAVTSAPVIKVVAPAQIAPPTSAPPSVAPGGKAGDGRGKPDERKVPATPAGSSAPVAMPQSTTPSQATPAVPAAPPTEQRGKSEQRGKGEQRGQPVAPPLPSQDSAQPQAIPPQATPPVPTAQPSDQRGKNKPRERPVAPPPAPSSEQVQRTNEPKALQGPAMQPSPQRSAQPRGGPPSQTAPPAAAGQQPLEADPLGQKTKSDAVKAKNQKNGSNKPKTEEELRKEELLKQEAQPVPPT